MRRVKVLLWIGWAGLFWSRSAGIVLANGKGHQTRQPGGRTLAASRIHARGHLVAHFFDEFNHWLKAELFHPRNWQSTTVEQFIQAVDSYIRSYDERRIKSPRALTAPSNTERISDLRNKTSPIFYPRPNENAPLSRGLLEALELRSTWTCLALLPVIDRLTRDPDQLPIVRRGNAHFCAMRGQSGSTEAALRTFFFRLLHFLCASRALGYAAQLLLDGGQLPSKLCDRRPV